MLQEVEEERVAQTTPPCCTSVTIERDSVLEPVPQDLVQEPYADQPETLQFTAQAKRLHGRVFERVGHTIPPLETRVRTERVFVLVPEAPQDAVHGA